jgi:CheY-like chemotaxis protein
MYPRTTEADRITGADTFSYPYRESVAPRPFPFAFSCKKHSESYRGQQRTAPLNASPIFFSRAGILPSKISVRFTHHLRRHAVLVFTISFIFYSGGVVMNTYRLLHVEDEPDIREVVEISLSLDPGITLMSCASGADALVTAVHWKPDVILLDVMMPGMDGPQTLTHLRENKSTANIPVVFMTARAQNREVEHFLSLGAVGVIPKPFDPMTLATALRSYLPAEQPLH